VPQPREDGDAGGEDGDGRGRDGHDRESRGKLAFEQDAALRLDQVGHRVVLVQRLQRVRR
jgi:hypothetical protein